MSTQSKKWLDKAFSHQNDDIHGNYSSKTTNLPRDFQDCSTCTKKQPWAS